MPKKIVKSKTPKLDKITDQFDGGHEIMCLEPKERFDSCIVGWVERFGVNPIVCYDRDKVIALNIEDGMTEEEAEEFYEFNTLGSWVGDGTPAFLTRV